MCIAKGSVQTTKVHKFLVIFFPKMCFSLRVMYWKKNAGISQSEEKLQRKMESKHGNKCVCCRGSAANSVSLFQTYIVLYII